MYQHCKYGAYDSFELEPPGDGTARSGGDGGKIGWKLSQVNTGAVSRRELIDR